MQTDNLENNVNDEVDSNTSTKSEKRLIISKAFFSLGFLIYIILSFYPQYKYSPPLQNNSSNYWENYLQELERFYSGDRIDPNSLYPQEESFSDIDLIIKMVKNGYVSYSFYSICLLVLDAIFFLSFLKEIFSRDFIQ